MLVIVEGVDGSGKSTLVQQIRENVQRYIWMIRSSTRPNNFHEIDTLCLWTQIGLAMDLSLLFDRFPLISEPIYGKMIRGYSIVPPHYFQIGNRIASLSPVSNPPLIIYCRPSKAIIEQRINNQPQMEGVLNNFDALLSEYDFAMSVLNGVIPGRVVTYRPEEGPESIFTMLREAP